jgi:HD-GYP domain-containing protein (c-di-GMP phosphodiesterase class II)
MRPGLGVWTTGVAAPALVLVFVGAGPLRSTTWTVPAVAFWLITVAAAWCMVGAAWVLWLGHRRDLAEVGVLGASLFALSLFGFVHGTTTPGVLVRANGAASVASCIALPAGLVVAFPLLLRRSRLARIAIRHWRAWTTGSLVVMTGVAATMLVAPESMPHAPPADSPFTAIGVGLVMVAMLRLSWDQLVLYRVGRRPASLFTAVAIGELGVVSLVFILPPDYSPTWWLAHALDVAFVLVACVGLAVAYPADRSFAELFDPVLRRDPVVALELGLAPEIRAFVAALGLKDELTRLHVVRVAELASRLATRARLPAETIRAVGLGGLLHDLGKLLVPDSILTKPASLDDDEIAVMRRHPLDGARLLLASPAAELLAPAARIVRWHHERYDGLGYPDGLVGQDVPLEVSLVAVSDAWDAMTATRQYRAGMTDTQARELIQEGAGTQWDPQAVELLLTFIESAEHDQPPLLAQVGVSTTDPRSLPGICTDALPVALHRIGST